MALDATTHIGLMKGYTAVHWSQLQLTVFLLNVVNILAKDHLTCLTAGLILEAHAVVNVMVSYCANCWR